MSFELTHVSLHLNDTRCLPASDDETHVDVHDVYRLALFQVRDMVMSTATREASKQVDATVGNMAMQFYRTSSIYRHVITVVDERDTTSTSASTSTTTSTNTPHPFIHLTLHQYNRALLPHHTHDSMLTMRMASLRFVYIQYVFKLLWSYLNDGERGMLLRAACRDVRL